MNEKAKQLGNEYALPQHLAVDEQGHLQTSDIQGAGLTKREMFAMHAMQGYIAGVVGWTDGLDGGAAQLTAEEAARESVAYADALLEELANE